MLTTTTIAKTTNQDLKVVMIEQQQRSVPHVHCLCFDSYFALK